MHLHELYLLNFKNYEQLTLQFPQRFNCIIGRNGSGKTNLLDAIFYLCMTKSASQTMDTLNIRHGENYFVVRGALENEEGNLMIGCQVQKGKSKSFQCDRKEYPKLSDHIGRFPCVLIAPNDTDLIREGSETRRSFFDRMICQTNQNYLHQLQRYNHALKSRNQLLKQFAESGRVDKDLLEPYDRILIDLSYSLSESRNEATQAIIPLLSEQYAFLTDQQEIIALEYRSQSQQPSFTQNFARALEKDLILQRTTQGIHKDEYMFTLGEDRHLLKKFGSQGQQKSFIIALKLAEFQWIKGRTDKTPLLLMDDIFDKLDEHRIARLIELIESDNFGQIFLSDARPERSRQLLAPYKEEVAFFETESLG